MMRVGMKKINIKHIIMNMRSKIMSLALLLTLASCGEKQGMPEANNEYAVVKVQTTDAPPHPTFLLRR